MDQIDFEELIDLGANLSLNETQNENKSQKDSQEPLVDVLDKMCAAIGDPLKCDIEEAEIDTVVNFEESEEKICVAKVESNVALDDPITCNTDEAESDTVINLDEFEHILAATYISNNCTDIDETGNIVDNDNITNTAVEIIKPVLPYNLSIDFQEIPATFTEYASLDEDKKLTSYFNSAVELETLVAAVNGAENEYNLETAKLEDVDISFNEDIINVDEFMNNCSYIEEENTSIIGNSSNRKRINTPKDSDNDIITINSDSDDGYNSSDFEFISEDEANKEGIVFKTKVALKKSMHGDIACTHAAPYNTHKSSTSNPHRNEASPSEYIKYSKYRYQHCYAELSSKHHVVPEGEQYLDMFRGQFAPVIVNNLHVMTNKSVLPTTPMAAMFDDLGFNIPENLGEEHTQYTDEAEECAKKIRSIYPGENSKRRRRF